MLICTYNEEAVKYFLWFIYVVFEMFNSHRYLANRKQFVKISDLIMLQECCIKQTP